jgi:translocator protein
MKQVIAGVKLVVSLALPLGAGTIAGIFTAKAVPEWYASLNRPSFSPPNWVFGPIWTVLYILLGISLFLIWKLDPGKERNRAIFIFLLQMLLNFGWSFLFFHFKMVGVALVEIMVLWMSILLMLFHFYKIDRMAAYINIPYLLWVTFATILNLGYYWLNRG